MVTEKNLTRWDCGARGLTLTELLTVIAIIGILAAILISVASWVRDSARVSKCVGNLRSYSQAIHLYASDHNGDLPTVRNQANNNTIYYDTLRVGGYMGVDQQLTGESSERFISDAWFCPSTEVVHGFRHRFYYGFNWNFGFSDSDPGKPNRMVNVKSPSETVMIADAWSPDRTTPHQYSYWIRGGGPSFQGRLDFRHNGKANVAFFDGSINVVAGPDNPDADSVTGRVFWGD